MTTSELLMRSRRLPDGTTIGLRELDASDEDALRRLFYRLSPNTVRLRFLQPIHDPSPRVLHYLADVDHDRRQALAAVYDGEVIGVARYDRLRDDPAKAEVAVVVEDAWQGHGVGRVLLDALAKDARQHGVASLVGTVMGENRRMVALTKHLAPQSRVRIDHGEWDVETPLASS